MKELYFLSVEFIKIPETDEERDFLKKGFVGLEAKQKCIGSNQTADIFLEGQDGRVFLVGTDDDLKPAIDVDAKVFQQNLEEISVALESLEEKRLPSRLQNLQNEVRSRLSKSVFQNFWEDFFSSLMEELDDPDDLNPEGDLGASLTKLRKALDNFPDLYVGRFATEDQNVYGIMVTGKVEQNSKNIIRNIVSELNLGVPIRLEFV